MFVKDRMRSCVPLSPGMTLAEAYRQMVDGGFEGLPVTEHGVVAGVVTLFDCLRAVLAGPGGAGLGSTTVGEAMTRQPITVAADEIIEEAAFLMQKHDIDVLPVTDAHGHCAGIVTERDMFRVFVELMGLRERGTRIALRVEDKVGQLAEIARIIRRHDVSIASVATFDAAHNTMSVVVRLRTIDARPVVDALRRHGFMVLHVSQVWE